MNKFLICHVSIFFEYFAGDEKSDVIGFLILRIEAYNRHCIVISESTCIHCTLFENRTDVSCILFSALLHLLSLFETKIYTNNSQLNEFHTVFWKISVDLGSCFICNGFAYGIVLFAMEVLIS